MKSLCLEILVDDLPCLRLCSYSPKSSHLENLDLRIRYIVPSKAVHFHEDLLPLIKANQLYLKTLKLTLRTDVFRLPRIDVSQLLVNIGVLRSLSLISLSGGIIFRNQGALRTFLVAHGGTLTAVRLNPNPALRNDLGWHQRNIQFGVSGSIQEAKVLRYIEDLSLTLLAKSELDPILEIARTFVSQLVTFTLRGLFLSPDDLLNLCQRLSKAPRLRYLTVQVNNPLPKIINLVCSFPDLEKLHLIYTNKDLGVSLIREFSDKIITCFLQMTRDDAQVFFTEKLDEEALKMWKRNRIYMNTVSEMRMVWD